MRTARVQTPSNRPIFHGIDLGATTVTKGRETMTKYLAGVLSVIAAGVLLIAYGLLSPRVGAFGSPAEFNQFARPMPVSESMLLRDDPYAARYATRPTATSRRRRTATTIPRIRPQVVEARPVRTARDIACSTACGGAGRRAETQLEKDRAPDRRIDRRRRRPRRHLRRQEGCAHRRGHRRRREHDLRGDEREIETLKLART